MINIRNILGTVVKIRISKLFRNWFDGSRRYLCRKCFDSYDGTNVYPISGMLLILCLSVHQIQEF